MTFAWIFYLFVYTTLYFQGGFAKCYELIDMDTKDVFAGKIVSKSLLVKQHQKDKVLAMDGFYNASLSLYIYIYLSL